MVQGTEEPTRLTRGEIHRRIAEMTSLRLDGDLERFLEHFDDRAVVQHDCTKKGLFTRGVMKGKAEFRQNLYQTEEVYRGVDGEVLDVLVEGQCAWLRWRTRWLHIGAGKAYDLDMAYFLRWGRDKIVELHEFFDRPNPSPYRPPLLGSFDDMITPRPPGLNRDEILAVMDALANLPKWEGPDVALIKRFCAPNIVCEFVGDRKRIPYAGRHVGVEALSCIMRAIATEFEQLSHELANVVVDDGRVAARRSVEWRHRGTGRHGQVEIADFVKFEAGRIVEFIEYGDSFTLIEMGS
jgi:ketosteroid isomerase-like protein